MILELPTDIYPLILRTPQIATTFSRVSKLAGCLAADIFKLSQTAGCLTISSAATEYCMYLGGGIMSSQSSKLLSNKYRVSRVTISGFDTTYINERGHHQSITVRHRESYLVFFAGTTFYILRSDPLLPLFGRYFDIFAITERIYHFVTNNGPKTYTYPVEHELAAQTGGECVVLEIVTIFPVFAIRIVDRDEMDRNSGEYFGAKMISRHGNKI